MQNIAEFHIIGRIGKIDTAAQPKAINRTMLLETALPTDWADQETLLGFQS